MDNKISLTELLRFILEATELEYRAHRGELTDEDHCRAEKLLVMAEQFDTVNEKDPISLTQWARIIHENAKKHGWWEKERPFAEIVALCHSELSEALEEDRKNRGLYYSGVDGKPEGIAVEMADCLIRILDWFGHVADEIDVEEIVMIKHRFNQERPYKHGKEY